MKLKLKSIVAAVALAAVAGHAAAAIQPGTITQGTTGSELVFYAFDDVTKSAYTKDLGSSFSAALGGTTLSSNISADTNWLSYLTSVSSSTSNTYWGVLAVEKTSATSAGGFQILTTARGNAPTVTGQSSGNLTAIDGVFNSTYLGALQGTIGLNYALNDSYFRDGSTGAASWANSVQHNVLGKLVFNTDNLIGTTANFYKLARAGTNAVAPTLTTVANQTWTFDGSTINASVAAVPEPGTYAMMVAGLLLVGGIARRRLGQ